MKITKKSSFIILLATTMYSSLPVSSAHAVRPKIFSCLGLGSDSSEIKVPNPLLSIKNPLLANIDGDDETSTSLSTVSSKISEIADDASTFLGTSSSVVVVRNPFLATLNTLSAEQVTSFTKSHFPTFHKLSKANNAQSSDNDPSYTKGYKLKDKIKTPFNAFMERIFNRESKFLLAFDSGDFSICSNGTNGYDLTSSTSSVASTASLRAASPWGKDVN